MLESDPKWLFWGLAGSQEPQGRSSWSKMVPGHWYNVPHYATALPGRIVGFKIPKLGKMWPRIVILGCILGVSGSQDPPYAFKLV